MLIDKKGVDEVIDLIQPEAFYKTAHQIIFEAIFQLFQDSQPIDLLTVSSELKKKRKIRKCRRGVLFSPAISTSSFFSTY